VEGKQMHMGEPGLLFTKFGYLFKVTARGVAMQNTHGAWVLIFVYSPIALHSSENELPNG
jgi:hypothetical protein